MASHPSCGVHWKLVSQSSIAVSLEKSFEFKFLTKSRNEHLSSPLSQKENSLCQELLWCKCCFETWPAQKVPRIEFSKRNSPDLFCSGIRCQLTLNTLQKILTDRIITFFVLQMKCNCTWPPSSDHLRTLSCGRLKSRMESFNFCQKRWFLTFLISWRQQEHDDKKKGKTNQETGRDCGWHNHTNMSSLSLMSNHQKQFAINVWFPLLKTGCN